MTGRSGSRKKLDGLWISPEKIYFEFFPGVFRSPRGRDPTANWPYSLQDPAGRMVVACNGRGFRTVKQARAAVELVLAGIAIIEIDGLARVDAIVEGVRS
jgi:hypothetical protein